jgi:L-alanine-DL-glutamate epimerase-like enolase superfamily enzyme
MLIGQDPFDREKFWQLLWAAKTPENLWSVVDMALWDLLGRVTNLPIYKLLGGCRDRVRAYGSTYPNMGPPEVYAEHALACKRQGYTAYKIHPYYYWDPATGQAMAGRPSHIDWDIRCCRAVREAVGDDMVLMYDPWGTYHIYEEALKVGRELERLNFYWYEHPMPEHRMESYVRLARDLSIPICSPDRGRQLFHSGRVDRHNASNKAHRRARHYHGREGGGVCGRTACGRSTWRPAADPGRHQRDTCEYYSGAGGMNRV